MTNQERRYELGIWHAWGRNMHKVLAGTL